MVEEIFSLAVVCLPEVDTPVAAFVMVCSRAAMFLAAELDDFFALAGVFATVTSAVEEAFRLSHLEFFSAAFGFSSVATGGASCN